MASTPDAGLNGGQDPGISAAELFGGASAGDAGAGGDQGAGGEAAGEGAAEGAGDLGGADPAFYAEVPAELVEGEKTSLRDWLKASGVKDIAGLAKIARDNQLALRASGQVKVPGEGAKPEEIAAFHRAIGVPDKPEDYALPVPKDGDGNPLVGADGKPVQMNEPLLGRLAQVAHKFGVPKGAYEALIADFVAAQMEENAIAGHAEQAEAKAKLKEWGTQGNAKMSAINNALDALGLNRDEAVKLRGALGAGRAMEMFAKLGEGIAEDSMLEGGTRGRFGITGAQAQEELDKLRKDPATRDKIFVKGTAERARYDRLQAIIGQEADRKAAQGQ
jgi:hypothetical protein